MEFIIQLLSFIVSVLCATAMFPSEDDFLWFAVVMTVVYISTLLTLANLYFCYIKKRDSNNDYPD